MSRDLPKSLKRNICFSEIQSTWAQIQGNGGMHTPNNLAATPQYFLWKWKISHTSQFQPPVSKNDKFLLNHPLDIKKWSILLNHLSNVQHRFASLSIKRDFGYFFSNLILQTRNLRYSRRYPGQLTTSSVIPIHVKSV